MIINIILITDEKMLIIEVKSGLSEPRNAIDHGRFTTRIRAAKANN